jgi:hypothetical protein
VPHRSQDLVAGSGGEQRVERVEDRLGVAEHRQLVRRCPDRPIERPEPLPQRRPDQSGQPAGGLAPFPRLVHGRLEVEVFGIGQHPVEVVDRVAESLRSDPPDLTLRPPARLDHIPHASSQLPHRAGSNVTVADGTIGPGPTGGRSVALRPWGTL